MAEKEKTVWPTGTEVVARLAAEGKPVHLAFSCGKDSLALWLKLRDGGVEVRPCYRYLVPGLEFVEESIAYHERAFGVKINRAPHVSIWRWLRNFTFQAPENLAAIEQAGIPSVDTKEGQEDGLFACGLPLDTWTAIGTRACDNPFRRMSFSKHGPWHLPSHSVYPVWDMNKDGVIDTIARSGIKLPSEYRIFGRSFDGLDFRFLHGIKKHWPRDYEKILEWFPLARLELMRYDIQQKRDLRRAAAKR